MEVMRTNYMGTLNVTHAFLPHMRERRSGTILLFGSRTAYRNEFVVSRALPEPLYLHKLEVCLS